MKELKPCPMCGAAPKLIVGFSPIGHAFVDCECGMQTALKDEADDVVAMWNRRAAPAIPQAAGDAGQAPVAQWQTKLREPILPECDVWINVNEEGAKKAREQWSHVYEVRALYAAPVAPAAAAPSAFDQLKAELLADDEYAWSWHCNLAMPIMDSLHCTPAQANKAGADLMQYLFGIDIRKHEHWHHDEPAPNTGHAEADRIINRLMSSDPEFDDCADAVDLIRKPIADYRTLSKELQAVAYIPDAPASSEDAIDAQRYRKCREHAVKRGFLPTPEQYDAMVDESIERMEVAFRTGHNYGKKMQPDGTMKTPEPIREPGYDIHGDRLG